MQYIGSLMTDNGENYSHQQTIFGLDIVIGRTKVAGYTPSYCSLPDIYTIIVSADLYTCQDVLFLDVLQ